MKVFILVREVPFEFTDIYGIFASRTAAETEQNDAITKHCFQFGRSQEHYKEQFIIQEWELSE